MYVGCRHREQPSLAIRASATSRKVKYCLSITRALYYRPPDRYVERPYKVSPQLANVVAASCPTAPGALCGQLTFRLAWCREHSAVTTTELLQPLDLACGTLFRSSCAIQTSPTVCSDDSWRNIFSASMNEALCDFWHAAPWKTQKHLLTYLLTYSS